jgi:hypothetical protein
MTPAEMINVKVGALSEADQYRVLELLSAMGAETASPVARIDPCGMFARRGVHLSADEFAAARQELWAGIPREYPGCATP